MSEPALRPDVVLISQPSPSELLAPEARRGVHKRCHLPLLSQYIASLDRAGSQQRLARQNGLHHRHYPYVINPLRIIPKLEPRVQR
jgi:hypothetical protein